MKLHYVPRTRASRPRWMLEEAGAVHELARVDVKGGQNKTTEYREIHPHGSVPALVEDGVSIVESSAICMAVADKFPDKHLAPKPGTLARARYYQWMVYVPATVDPCLSEIAKSKRLPEDQQEHAAADAKARWKEIARFLDKSLSDNDYFVENTFSAADVMLGSVLLWANSMKLLEDHSSLQAYVERVRSRPAYLRATHD